MKFLTLVSAFAVAIPAAFALTINTPSNVVECEPTQFTWSGGTAPYYFTLVPAAQISAPAIKQFTTQTGNSFTWVVDLQSSTSFTAVVKDSSGASAFSDIITIEAGTSTSCVNLSVLETATASSAATATGASASTTGTSKSATSTAAGSSSTHSSGAGRLSVASAFGVTGIMGLVGAALF